MTPVKLVTGWNKTCEEITGYTATEAIGQSRSLVCSKNKECKLFDPEMEKPIKGRECTLLTKDGTIRNAKKSADLLLDADGNIIGGIECFEDITEQKIMLDTLFHEKTKLKSILKATGQGISSIKITPKILKDLFGDKCYTVYKQRNKPCKICRMQIALETDRQQKSPW